MTYLRMIVSFIRSSIQKDLAYRANFGISLLHSLINLGVGILSLHVIFSQVTSLHGWQHGQAIALLGVYLLISALRGLFIGPSLEALVGLGQEVWTGSFDFSLLRPVSLQFMITFRHWNLFSLVDLIFGLVVLIYSCTLVPAISMLQVAVFLIALSAAVVILYSVLLLFTSLTFWNPGYLFTWVFDSLFQLARYPVSIYPPWLRFTLTWLLPVGVMTTIPAQALTASMNLIPIAGSLTAALSLLVLSSRLFKRAVRHYASASS
jgi:ABC-2 type transport system permease protein